MTLRVVRAREQNEYVTPLDRPIVSLSTQSPPSRVRPATRARRRTQ